MAQNYFAHLPCSFVVQLCYSLNHGPLRGCSFAHASLVDKNPAVWGQIYSAASPNCYARLYGAPVATTRKYMLGLAPTGMVNWTAFVAVKGSP